MRAWPVGCIEAEDRDPQKDTDDQGKQNHASTDHLPSLLARTHAGRLLLDTHPVQLTRLETGHRTVGAD